MNRKFGYEKGKYNVSFHPQHLYDVILPMRNVILQETWDPLHIFGMDKARHFKFGM